MAALGTDRGWAEKVRMTAYSTLWRDLCCRFAVLEKLPIADPTFWCTDGVLRRPLHGETPRPAVSLTRRPAVSLTRRRCRCGRAASPRSAGGRLNRAAAFETSRRRCGRGAIGDRATAHPPARRSRS